MPRYYHLAHGTKPTIEGFPWPYDVHLCFGGVNSPVGFSQGVAHGAAGGTFSFEEALKPHWRAHIEAANGLWLIPYIERMARGETIMDSEVIQRYEQLQGTGPTWYDTTATRYV